MSKDQLMDCSDECLSDLDYSSLLGSDLASLQSKEGQRSRTKITVFEDYNDQPRAFNNQSLENPTNLLPLKKKSGKLLFNRHLQNG